MTREELARTDKEESVRAFGKLAKSLAVQKPRVRTSAAEFPSQAWPGLSCNQTPSVQSRPLSLAHPFSSVPAARLRALCSTATLRGRQLAAGPSHTMEALSIQLLKDDRVSLGRQEQENTRIEGLYPWGEEEHEWEPPPSVRRKVSFADAFGLDLVSIKEYDEVNAAQDPGLTEKETAPPDEFYLSCLFTAPSSEEELVRRLESQMVELEKVELLPGTTTFRGSVRVLNLCFSKSVYARITLDCWKSYFDLLADYVPGSSDRKTDRFTFQYTVVPPLDKGGTRVEFCLRYETSAGTFWANNQEMNYVMFCHQKSAAKQQVQEDTAGLKMKRSCLRANRRASTQEKEGIDTVTLVADVEAPCDAEKREESPSLFSPAERKPLVASLKSRQRAARLAHVKEIFSQRWGQASSRDPTGTLQPSGEFLLKRQRKQVLTYHQIPLITLDWDNDKQQQWVSSNVNNIWTGRTKVKENAKGGLSVNDIWGTFLNGKGPSPDNESSECDVWQAFINGPRYEDNCSVPESEWLQTAASVPSTSEIRNVRLATLAASAVGQALSHALPAHVSSNCEDSKPSETRGGAGGGSRGENTVAVGSHTQPDATTLRECSSAGTKLVSCGSVDSLRECRKREEERIKGGLLGDEVAKPHTAAVATSLKEWTTTDMTAEAQNPGHEGDRILRRENPKLEDTGGEHDTMNETVAFQDGITINITTKEHREFEKNLASGALGDSESQDRSNGQQETGYSPTIENISRREIAIKQQRGQDIENLKYSMEDTYVKSTESEPFVSETVEAIESRLEGGEIQDDSVRKRSNTNIDVLAKSSNDPSGCIKISSEETEESTHSLSRGSGGFMWWSMLYILSHITRIVTYGLVVAGFFIVIVLYDFPAFFVLYMFSMAWWFYKWRGRQGPTNKAIVS
ncbi:uncharacterized protein ppp1r3aa [Corythoichthys intestinalis]|uniref:uncharacterized protein ppp1r3aa n=1 Tax=Corythoichthys intestinalis TaxID=161448 RepID=UPI0025A59365|nr:uncharacterized protein ppp1r3aa [Corythoichthys intestinalis]